MFRKTKPAGAATMRPSRSNKHATTPAQHSAAQHDVIVASDFDGTLTDKNGESTVFETIPLSNGGQMLLRDVNGNFVFSSLYQSMFNITPNVTYDNFTLKPDAQSTLTNAFTEFENLYNDIRDPRRITEEAKLYLQDLLSISNQLSDKSRLQIFIFTKNNPAYVVALLKYEGFSPEQISQLRIIHSDKGFRPDEAQTLGVQLGTNRDYRIPFVVSKASLPNTTILYNDDKAEDIEKARSMFFAQPGRKANLKVKNNSPGQLWGFANDITSIANILNVKLGPPTSPSYFAEIPAEFLEQQQQQQPTPAVKGPGTLTRKRSASFPPQHAPENQPEKTGTIYQSSSILSESNETEPTTTSSSTAKIAALIPIKRAPSKTSTPVSTFSSNERANNNMASSSLTTDDIDSLNAHLSTLKPGLEILTTLKSHPSKHFVNEFTIATKRLLNANPADALTKINTEFAKLRDLTDKGSNANEITQFDAAIKPFLQDFQHLLDGINKRSKNDDQASPWPTKKF